MFGFTIYLMAFADWLAGRKRSGAKCDLCGARFESHEQKEDHRRKAHQSS